MFRPKVTPLKRSAAAIALGLAVAASAATPQAHAMGWISKHIIKPLAGRHAAEEADKIHRKLGKPLDAAAAAAKAAAGGVILN